MGRGFRGGRWEYDAVRDRPRRFFVLAGHDRPGRRTVVPAGDIAERTDPRQHEDPD
jgi:hypothetical protein